MILTAENLLAGYYKIVAHKLDGSSRVVADWFPNLITDAGLERIATGTYNSHCQVGSGTNAPTNADTQLQALVAQTSTVQNNVQAAQATPPYYGSRTITYRFGTGVAAGNLSEVGVGWAAAGSLFSRARILDGGGNPTTITVLSDEILDVIYQLRLYPPLVDHSFQVADGAQTYNCVSRASLVTSASEWAPPTVTHFFGIGLFSGNPLTAYNGPLGAITTTPSGTTGAFTGSSIGAYSANSKQRNFTFTAGLNDANIAGGISAIKMGNYSNTNVTGICVGTRQISFSPAIVKDNTKTLSLTIRVSWARASI